MLTLAQESTQFKKFQSLEGLNIIGCQGRENLSWRFLFDLT